MANGFVSRDLGKVKVKDVWLGAATASECSVVSASTSAVTPNMGYISFSTLTTASGNVTLGTPFAGAFITLGSTAASTGFKILASSSGQVNFCSTNFAVVLGSTTAGIVTASQSFVGISTSQWMPVGGGFGAALFSTV